MEYDNVICDNCQDYNSFENKFCKNCGKSLEKIDQKETWKVFKLIKHLSIIFYKGAKNNIYLILLFLSLAYFFTYIILMFFLDKNKYDINIELLGFIKEISLIIFSAGIFTCALKYLQYLDVFKKDFEKIIFSKRYNDVLKQNIESITLSEDFFLKQNNIESIWQTVTLSKYKKEFPELYDSIKSKLENELFKKSNIEYYYKNVHKIYSIDLMEDEKYIEIREETNYSVIRNSENAFIWDCHLKILKEDSENGKYPDIDVKIINDLDVTYQKDDEKEIKQGKFLIKKIEKKLQGKKEYHIKRTVKIKQNLNHDREYSFGSSRIIDDISVSLRYSKRLKVIFSEVGKVKFYKDEENVFTDIIEKTYINRGVLTPGEKFKLFFIKA